VLAVLALRHRSTNSSVAPEVAVAEVARLGVAALAELLLAMAAVVAVAVRPRVLSQEPEAMALPASQLSRHIFRGRNENDPRK
jgi:hypothetical protein